MTHSRAHGHSAHAQLKVQTQPEPRLGRTGCNGQVVAGVASESPEVAAEQPYRPLHTMR